MPEKTQKAGDKPLLFADNINAQAMPEVVAEFEDLSGSISFNSELISADDLYNSQSSSGAMLFGSDVDPIASNIKTYIIKQANGYIQERLLLQ